MESDIFLNPNVNWSLNSEDIPFQEGTYVDLTLIHELGHVLGLGENFVDLSVMNPPRRFDGEYAVKASDIANLRLLQANADISEDDLGLFLFRDAGYQFYSDAVVYANGNPSTTFDAGDVITVENFTVESMASPLTLAEIHWWLTPSFQSMDGADFLGRSDLEIVPGMSSIIDDQFTVPTTMRPGDYFLAASIISATNSVKNVRNLAPCHSHSDQSRASTKARLTIGGDVAEYNNVASSAALDAAPAAVEVLPPVVGGGGGGGVACSNKVQGEFPMKGN